MASASSPVMTKNLPANHYPSELPTVVAPRSDRALLPDCRSVGVGSAGPDGPSAACCRICLYQTAPPERRPTCMQSLLPTRFMELFDAEVLDTKGNCYLRLTATRLWHCRMPWTLSSESPAGGHIRRGRSSGMTPCDPINPRRFIGVRMQNRIPTRCDCESRRSRDAVYPCGPRVQPGARQFLAYHRAVHRA